MFDNAEHIVRPFYLGNEWTECCETGGVSDGGLLFCSICGGYTQFDYSVSNDLWYHIVPREHRRGVVCLPCLDQLCVEYKRDLGVNLHRIEFVGTGITIDLLPAIRFYHDAHGYNPANSANE